MNMVMMMTMTLFPRLLLLLGLVDTLHLVTSLITFSLPTLAPALGESASIIRWSLPIAQVSTGPRSHGVLMTRSQELDGDVCLHDHIHDCGEVSFCCSPSLHLEKQVIYNFEILTVKLILNS